MAQSNSTSIFVESQVPDFVNRDGPDLVNFIKTYYEWMELPDNPINVSRQLLRYRDVDLVPDKHFQYIRSEIMRNIPNARADERLIAKNILDFYRARGTEKSYRMLFRMIYNVDDISFYYPGKDMLRASDGKWVVDRSLRLNMFVPVDHMENVVIIEGLGSTTKAKLDNFQSFVENGVVIYELFYNGADGEFSVGEEIRDSISGELLGQILIKTTYNGRWINTDGFLSWDKYLQDNFYYQEFSYQINSPKSLATYTKVAHDLVHPAGTKLFGKVQTSDVINLEAGIQTDFRVNGEDVRRVIDYEIILDNDAWTILPIEQNPNPEYGIGLQRTEIRNQVTDWLNVKVFDDGFWNASVNDFMDRPVWFVSNTSTFTHPTDSAISISHNSYSEVFVYSKSVVNTTLVLLDAPYPHGETTNLTYKYHIIL